MTPRGVLCLIALVVACGGRTASGTSGLPAASASEQDLRNDLLRLHRDQEAFRIRFGTYAAALQDLDFRASDDVSLRLRLISAQSYYAVAESGEVECIIGSWITRPDLPTDIQARLVAPGTPTCRESRRG